jgi:hypothetical protein
MMGGSGGQDPYQLLLPEDKKGRVPMERAPLYTNLMPAVISQ